VDRLLPPEWIALGVDEVDSAIGGVLAAYIGSPALKLLDDVVDVVGNPGMQLTCHCASRT